MRFPGIIPAVTTPFDADGAVDHRRAGGATSPRCSTPASTASSPPARWARPARSAREERRRRGRTAVRAAAGRVPVIAGVSVGHARRRRSRYAADAAAAGADAIMLLPPLGYRGDEREIDRVLPRGGGRAPALPIMAYNNPEASGDRPAGRADRAARRRGRRRSSRSRSARATRAGSRRCSAAAPDLEVLVGGDDWALEGFCAGATGWVSGVADCAPAECVELYDACRAGDLGPRARGLRAAAPARAARHDAEARPVLQGRAGRARLHRRAGARRRGWRSTTAERAILEAAVAALRAPVAA